MPGENRDALKKSSYSLFRAPSDFRCEVVSTQEHRIEFFSCDSVIAICATDKEYLLVGDGSLSCRLFIRSSVRDARVKQQSTSAQKSYLDK